MHVRLLYILTIKFFLEKGKLLNVLAPVWIPIISLLYAVEVERISRLGIHMHGSSQQLILQERFR